MSLQLRATKHQLADLKQICELGTDRLAKLQQELAKLPNPTLRPQDLLADVSKILGGDAEFLVRQLLALQGLIRRTGLPSEEVLGGIRDAIGRQGQEVGLENEAWAVVEPVIKCLVEEKSIRLVATAIELAYDYANLLRRIKILTDIRPLFDKPADRIEGAVISYTLRLHYDSADGEHELSIALDEADIRTLMVECGRAITKTATAKSLMADKCQIPVALSGDAKHD